MYFDSYRRRLLRYPRYFSYKTYCILFDYEYHYTIKKIFVNTKRENRQ